MELLFLLNIFLGVVAVIYLWIDRKLQFFKYQGIHHIIPKFYYGNAKDVGTKVHYAELFREVYLKFKSRSPIAGIYLYTNPVYLIADPELAKLILVKDFNNFPNRGRYFNEKDEPISANLANIEDESWRKLRNKITPTFTSGKIKMMFGLVTELADKLIQTIDNEVKDTKRSIDVKNTFARFTTDVIASAAFGIESNSLEDKTNKFLEMGLKVLRPESFFLKTLLASNRKIGNMLHIRTEPRDVEEFYRDVVKKTIEYREQNPQVQKNDFIDLLMKLRDPLLPDPLSFDQITAQCLIFFVAGYDTSSSCLTYCIYELSQNQEIQSKARESVKKVLEKHNNKMTYETCSEMHYLEQCINEALRMFPPAFRLDRRAKEDYPVPNTKFVIKKGSAVVIPTFAFHWDREIYPEPEKYDPDRFLPEEIMKRHAFTFLPFGEGPRTCIAMRFALFEIKVALAKLLLNFKFDLDRTRTTVPIKIAPNKLTLLTPAEGIFVNFHKF